MNDHTVPQLPPRSQCTGCAACAEGCPKNAIHMLPDREGFLYPTVTDACIQCGACEPRCPYNLPIRKMMKKAAEDFGE